MSPKERQFDHDSLALQQQNQQMNSEAVTKNDIVVLKQGQTIWLVHDAARLEPKNVYLHVTSQTRDLLVTYVLENLKFKHKDSSIL